MAGYIIGLNSHESLRKCIEDGVYGTVLPAHKKLWATPHEGTFADYAGMVAGDNVFFFVKRKIYGIGQLVNVGNRCSHLNFPDASNPVGVAPKLSALMWNSGVDPLRVHWICTFRPKPEFFAEGIDMDDVLSSNPPAFRMLRAFWNVSFIKCDDDENQALQDVFYKRTYGIANIEAFKSEYQLVHAKMQTLIDSGAYRLNSADLMAACASERAGKVGLEKIGPRLMHEMAIEAGLLAQLARRENDTVETFGEWDYVSHQVLASPFKPIDYADKIDVFGYRAHPDSKRTRVRYLVCEVKKARAQAEEIDQLMKYVDWVKEEYCHGDYSMIRAFLVAYSFSDEAITRRNRVTTRKYTVGRRPADTKTWGENGELALVTYRFDAAGQKLRFERIE